MITVVYILIALLALLILAALIPLRMNFVVSSREKRFLASYGPFFTLDTRDQQTTKAASSQSVEKNAEAPSARKRTSSRWGVTFKSLPDYLRLAPKTISALSGFAAAILRQIKVERLSGEISGGLDDPAALGVLEGFGRALFAAVPALGQHIRVRPDYLAENIEYNLSGTVSFRPIRALAPLARFLWDAPIIELIRITARK